MPKIDVEEQLKLRFLQPLPACMLRRVVIWHDADGEFAPEFERLAAEGFDGAGADAGVMLLTVTLSVRCGLSRPARAACLPSRSSSTAMTLRAISCCIAVAARQA